MRFNKKELGKKWGNITTLGELADAIKLLSGVEEAKLLLRYFIEVKKWHSENIIYCCRMTPGISPDVFAVICGLPMPAPENRKEREVMKQVWKWSLREAQNASDQRIVMPKGAKLLRVGIDPQGDECVWAEVDPNSDTVVDRRIIVAGTGQNIPPEAIYVGTINDGRYFMWHVYDMGEIQ